MATVDELKQKIAVVMFDQYGTVVDMQQGLTEVAAPFLKSKGWTGDPGSFVTWWRRTHFESSMIDALLHREHTPYREIGAPCGRLHDGPCGAPLGHAASAIRRVAIAALM